MLACQESFWVSLHVQNTQDSDVFFFGKVIDQVREAGNGNVPDAGLHPLKRVGIFKNDGAGAKKSAGKANLKVGRFRTVPETGFFDIPQSAGSEINPHVLGCFRRARISSPGITFLGSRRCSARAFSIRGKCQSGISTG